MDSQEKIDEVEAFQEGNDIDMEGELVVESWYSGEKQEKIFLYVENIELSF
ncbi:hypothetical protein [Picosynechococcus sp. NKBG042902]|uniref:hypothetical protein n=1 Tax=Picosynechococcus sp. NKBG042902 TaxID=490193 RepID=UPI000B16EF9F|nr:hypothetical protein [Picosynechococcus sp. NKBG042902]